MAIKIKILNYDFKIEFGTERGVYRFQAFRKMYWFLSDVFFSVETFLDCKTNQIFTYNSYEDIDDSKNMVLYLKHY